MKRILFITIFSIILYSAAYSAKNTLPVSYDLSSQELPSSFKAWFVDTPISDAATAKKQTNSISAKSLNLEEMHGTNSTYFFYYSEASSRFGIKVWADEHMTGSTSKQSLDWSVSLEYSENKVETISEGAMQFNHIPGTDALVSWGCYPIKIETGSILDMNIKSEMYRGYLHIEIVSIGE